MDGFLRAAGPILDRLFLTIGGAGYCLLLADRTGVPVERRGHPSDDAEFYRSGFWTGVLWSEAYEGTNGVGTALAEERPLTIFKDEHFFTRNIELSCTVAPLFGHTGELVGVLDVSSCRSDLDRTMVPLITGAVGEAARRIEATNFRQVFSAERIILAPQSTPDVGALLAVNSDDLVVGATRMARKLCDITSDSLAKGLLAEDILANRDQSTDALRSAERGTVRRAIIRAGGNISAAARELGVSRATLHRKVRALGLRSAGPA